MSKKLSKELNECVNKLTDLTAEIYDELSNDAANYSQLEWFVGLNDEERYRYETIKSILRAIEKVDDEVDKMSYDYENLWEDE